MDDISSRNITRKTLIDSSSENSQYWMRVHYSLGDARDTLQKHGGDASSTLFSRGKVSRAFFTADSHRYVTPLEQKAMLLGMRRHRRNGLQFDSVQMRYTHPRKSAGEKLHHDLLARYGSVMDTLRYLPDMLSSHISPTRVWNATVVSAIFFGMFSMTLIYRYFGQSASADQELAKKPATSVSDGFEPFVLGASTENEDENESALSESDKKALDAVTSDLDRKMASLAKKNAPSGAISEEEKAALQESIEQEIFEAAVRDLVKDYPIEKMLPYIFEQDRDVATYLIAIGKKESNWGKRVPVLDGQDCFNYWGYRGIRDKMGSGGHTCFDSRADAVKTVGARIKILVQEKKLDTPDKMIVWKCGYSCAGHSNYGVQKWISDVQMYVDKLK